MKNEKKKICLTLYGDILNDNNKWWNFYLYSIRLINELGFNANAIGAMGDSFKSGRVQEISKIEQKLKKSLEKGDYFTSLEVLALPPDYKQAAFDYDVSILIYRDYEPHHITVCINNNETLSETDVDNIVSELKSFITLKQGQLYELSSSEDQLIYAIKGKPATKFKGLNIIRDIN